MEQEYCATEIGALAWKEKVEKETGIPQQIKIKIISGYRFYYVVPE